MRKSWMNCTRNKKIQSFHAVAPPPHKTKEKWRRMNEIRQKWFFCVWAFCLKAASEKKKGKGIKNCYLKHILYNIETHILIRNDKVPLFISSKIFLEVNVNLSVCKSPSNPSVRSLRYGKILRREIYMLWDNKTEISSFLAHTFIHKCF